MDPPMFVRAEASHREGRSGVATVRLQEGEARHSRRPWLGLLPLIEEGTLSPEGMRARPSGGGQGGGRERGSGDRRWREVGEAASVRCGEVMATPCRWGLGCWANRNEVCRGDLGAHS